VPRGYRTIARGGYRGNGLTQRNGDTKPHPDKPMKERSGIIRVSPRSAAWRDAYVAGAGYGAARTLLSAWRQHAAAGGILWRNEATAG
jgi:hypothetical protein